MDKVFLDIEVSPNFMLIGYMYEDGTVKQHSAFGKKKSLKLKHIKALQELFKTHTMVTFNGMNYDSPVMSEMFKGKTCTEVYGISVDLVEQEGNRWDYGKATTNHIDLIEVAPQQASLKLYGARINTKKLQDLPYGVHDDLTKKQAKRMAKYNVNDLILTEELYQELLPQLKLRSQIGEQYKFDAMSKGEAQIATGIYNELLGLRKVPKQKIPKSVDYTAPDYIKFNTPELQDLLKKLQSESFDVGAGGSPIVPKWLKDTDIVVDDVKYTVQIGGIHSVNKGESIIPKDDEVYVTTDVASLYPSLMIQNKFYPEQISEKFGEVFEKIYVERQIAKRLSK